MKEMHLAYGDKQVHKGRKMEMEMMYIKGVNYMS